MCSISCLIFVQSLHKPNTISFSVGFVKKITHMWGGWGTPQNLFGIYWRTWKTTIHKKKLFKWANKNVRILIFTMHFKKITTRYHYFTPVYQESWWYDLQFLRYTVWQIEIGNHGSIFALLPLPLKNPK